MKFARAQYLVESLLDGYDHFFPEYRENIANLAPLSDQQEESLASKMQRVLLPTEEEKEKIRKLPMDRLAFLSRGSVPMPDEATLREREAERKRTAIAMISPGKRQEIAAKPGPASPVVVKKKAKKKLDESTKGIGLPAEEKKKKKKKPDEEKKKRKEKAGTKIRKAPSDADFTKKKYVQYSNVHSFLTRT